MRHNTFRKVERIWSLYQYGISKCYYLKPKTYFKFLGGNFWSKYFRSYSFFNIQKSMKLIEKHQQDRIFVFKTTLIRIQVI